MKAGPALDRQIAEKVMGWEPRYSVDFDCQDRWVVRNGEGAAALYSLTYHMNQWQPSTDIEHAWEVLAKLDLMWWPEVGRLNNGLWYCEICRGGNVVNEVGPPFRAIAVGAPEAICLAALLIIEQVTT